MYTARWIIVAAEAAVCIDAHRAFFAPTSKTKEVLARYIGEEAAAACCTRDPQTGLDSTEIQNSEDRQELSRVLDAWLLDFDTPGDSKERAIGDVDVAPRQSVRAGAPIENDDPAYYHVFSPTPLLEHCHLRGFQAGKDSALVLCHRAAMAAQSACPCPTCWYARVQAVCLHGRAV